MRADQFYQSSTEHAVPIVLLRQEHYQEQHLPAFEINSLRSQQFKAEIGNVGLIINSTGKLQKVCVGLEREDDSLALASVVNRLPAGAYSISGLSHQAKLNWSLAQYRYDDYKKSDAQPKVLCVDTEQLSSLLHESNAIFLVRDLINKPTSALGPMELSEIAEHLAKQYGATFQQWVGDELLKENFPAIHTVGRASSSAPRLISLTWGNPKHPRIALVGKGVCFDSGGLDIKPSHGMRLMKKDMAGAAHVLGLLQWLMARELPVYVQALIPAVENAIGSSAYRPGDVIRMRNGLTVEIDNTDAEGRLILADAFAKACEFQPELLIDFATLTGAGRVALGPDIAALFSNNDELARGLLSCAERRRDAMWRLPLFEGYEELYKSSIADIANSSQSPYGGAITAALFLQRFVTRGLPWAHFDIMAWNVANKPARPEGGEAMALLAVGEYLIDRFAV